jgi:hypothetical protein
MLGFCESSSKAGITQLLKAWGEGDDVALEQLTPVVENELRRIARRYMAKERPGHTLQSAALLNEVYLRLVDIQAVGWQDRSHFRHLRASDATNPHGLRPFAQLSETRRRGRTPYPG